MKKALFLVLISIFVLSAAGLANDWDDFWGAESVNCQVLALINDCKYQPNGDSPFIVVKVDKFKTGNFKNVKTSLGANPVEVKLYKDGRYKIFVKLHDGQWKENTFRYDGEKTLPFKFTCAFNNKLIVNNYKGNTNVPVQANVTLKWSGSGSWKYKTKHTNSAGVVEFNDLYANTLYFLSGTPDPAYAATVDVAVNNNVGSFDSYFQAKKIDIRYPGKITHAKPIPDVQPSAPVN